MNGYDLALVVHIGLVIAMFSSGALVLAAMGGARRAGSVGALVEWARMGTLSARLTAAFSLLLIAPAAYMVSDRWSWSRPWIGAAFVGLIVSGGSLSGLAAPRLRRLAELAAATPGGEVPAALRQNALDPLLWLGGQVFTTITSGVVVLMVFKPDGPASAIILVVAALLGVGATAPAFLRSRRG